ncbi:MAG: hypothetical protein OXC07_02195 [Kistimonas sp.]|nr:hypothetical protein [Kistimonas sp.]
MENEQDKVREFLAESEKLIRSGEKNLQRFEKLRKAMGLKPEASAAFLEKLPANTDLYKKARAMVDALQAEGSVEGGTTENCAAGARKSQKRSKLARAMQRRLRI